MFIVKTVKIRRIYLILKLKNDNNKKKQFNNKKIIFFPF